MSVQPNSACIPFCNYVLLEIPKRLTEARKTIVNEILAAAIAVTPVSDDDWYNFTLSTYDFYNSYLVYSTFKT